MIKITDLSHVSIIVADLDASRRFYRDILGLVEVSRPASFNFAGAWLRRGSAELHLIAQYDACQQPGDSATSPTERAGATLARHLAFAIEDTDEAVRVLQEHNIPIVQGPSPRGDGAIQTFIHDPDGHLIELHTLPDA